MRKIVILGSTGSIGTQALDVIRFHGDMQVTGLATGSNIKLLEQQIREFHPSLVSVWNESAAADLRVRIQDTNTKVMSGMTGLVALAEQEESDVFLCAVVGMVGIQPTLAAIRAKKTIAMANKETLVTAGHLIMPLAKELGVPILPIDSEHSAIFQCLNGEHHSQIQNLWITASGGPFRGRTAEQLADVRKEDALKHPNWAMGQKITIDSASLVNKGLEVMEARWLFDLPLDQIKVVVQPQSIIHSMVEFQDGAVIAQMGAPDMRVPIQYALYYPDRRTYPTEHLDFTTLSQIEFAKPDMETFRGLTMAIEAARIGGSMPTVFNAANEEAVSLFLKDQIRFLDIYRLIQEAMDSHKLITQPNLEQILETEKETRALVESRYRN